MKQSRHSVATRVRPSRAAVDARFSTASASFNKLMQLGDGEEQEPISEDNEVNNEERGHPRATKRLLRTGMQEEEHGGANDSEAERESVGDEEEEVEDEGEHTSAATVDVTTTASPAEADNIASSTSSSAPLSSSSLASFSAEMAATGLIYFSRLPPHMKPHKLRQLLAQYGHILRVYLTPEHQSLTHRRRSTTASSSSAAKRYTDGWVEFADKRIAKAVAVTLNGTTMGGRKRSYWYDDVWSCKYLKGFKWQHLTERGVMEGKGREGRRREEVGRAKREAEYYRQQMDKRRKVEAIRSRKDKQRSKGAATGQEDESSAAGEHDEQYILRTFHQRPAFPGKVLEE